MLDHLAAGFNWQTVCFLSFSFFIHFNINNERLPFCPDMHHGRVGDVAQLGITESYQVKRQVLVSGHEAAEMILRVDNIIKAAPRPRAPDHRHH